MVLVALGKHQIAQQLLGHHCSVRSEKQTAMAENSFDWCWCLQCTKTPSKSGFKHANCLLSLTRWQSIPASVPSSISWMNARYQGMTVGREMWITYNAVCIIIHQGLENVETFSSRPRPRPRLLFQDQDQDHFSCPRSTSRPKPGSRDYISAYSEGWFIPAITHSWHDLIPFSFPTWLQTEWI